MTRERERDEHSITQRRDALPTLHGAIGVSIINMLEASIHDRVRC
jgi:hypothetical protein